MEDAGPDSTWSSCYSQESFDDSFPMEWRALSLDYQSGAVWQQDICPTLVEEFDGREVGDILRAACAAAAGDIRTVTPPSWSAEPLLNSPRAIKKRLSLASSLKENGVTTLQCYGLHKAATVADLVQALKAERLSGCYNYVFIPHKIDGHGADGAGFAFINFTCAEAASLLVDLWDGTKGRHACFSGNVRCKVADKQGYQSYVTQKNLRRYERVRRTSLWPLVLTEEGNNVIFGSDEAIAAAVSW